MVLKLLCKWFNLKISITMERRTKQKDKLHQKIIYTYIIRDTYLSPYVLKAVRKPGQYARNNPRHVSDMSPNIR